ncbi:hypothetical protein CTAYLR_009389 [Chrysophaeum taylorii]|uniref:Glucosamine/galactosamine-6-phosphate isomerase domain-containing protein n=1 Tax=Chrysophaeum taylorii TaxID=2483200 RepID=A0AAD7ULI3_9STRA|nr:hypothetical protein CTAYLR_009389 [Chrysophaeum taylorii]
MKSVVRSLVLSSVVLGSAWGLIAPGIAPGIRRQSLVAMSECVEEFTITREIKAVRVFDGDFADEICDMVMNVGSAMIEKKGSFSLAIPGGSVVTALGRLDDDAFDFDKMHVFFCNEQIGENKCYEGALESFVEAKGVPLENVHGVGEGEPAEVAERYGNLLCSHPSIDNDGALPSIDMVLLGTGADGHCGSLYPNSPEIKQTGSGKLVYGIDEKKSVAMSMDLFCAAKVGIVSAAGAGRSEMVAKALSGEFGDWDCPAALVDCREETYWFVDEDSIADFNDIEEDLEDEEEGD